MEICNQGIFRRVEIPDGWYLKPLHDPAMIITEAIEFKMPGEENVSISFFFRGRPESEVAADAFFSLLALPPHELTGDELQECLLVLDNLADEKQFAIASARTENLNGRCVFIVEGSWLPSQIKTKHMFIDTDGDGSIIQEVYFLAPPEKFERYLPLAEATFNSFEWKSVEELV